MIVEPFTVEGITEMIEAKIGRLAMRVEDDQWVAYYAMSNTMDYAMRLGQVSMQIVQDKVRKQAFIDLMMSFVAELIEKTAKGGRVEWGDPIVAPEHERTPRTPIGRPHDKPL